MYHGGHLARSDWGVVSLCGQGPKCSYVKEKAKYKKKDLQSLGKKNEGWLTDLSCS